MPPQLTLTQLRLNNIVTCLHGVLSTLEVISRSLSAPFLQPISNTLKSLLTTVQTVKKNKDKIIQMLEQIHGLLYAVIKMHTDSETGGELPPDTVVHLGKFTETLHKIHNFVEAQQEKSGIKYFFHQGEMSTLLKGCQSGLEQAFNVFKVQNLGVLGDLSKMQLYARQIHQEVLDLISSHSDGASSDRTSFISGVLSPSQYSLDSLSLLPSEPKIFHGRESELAAIIQAFSQKSPRVAVLGAGGMGKTSLARAVLHHPEITARYDQHRVFVSCDSTFDSVQLIALIGTHIGLKPDKDITRLVIAYFASGTPYLLVLDNLETLWEPLETRKEVEKLLALLSDVANLAIIITMRGAERPGNVQWSHPFLEPLMPLTQDAARKTFNDIVDNHYTTADMDKILSLSDNLPLALDLIAHLVNYEGLKSVLGRWETESTSLLSEGHNKDSNLDFSIALSLESPRMTSLPHSHELLSLLSILPDGLSDVELMQSDLPINNILACKVALLRTSLAYTDDQCRLKILVPIREYMQKRHPPMPWVVQPLLKYFHKLLEIYGTYRGTVSGAGMVPRITSNLANIQNLLIRGLHKDNQDLTKIIYSACDLDLFSLETGHGQSLLMQKIPNVISQPNDHRLEAYFIRQLIAGWTWDPIVDDLHLVDKALEHFKYFDDPDLKCAFYDTISHYYQFYKNDSVRALEFTQTGLTLAVSTRNSKRQATLLISMARIKWQSGSYLAAKTYTDDAQRVARSSGDLYNEARALDFSSMCWYSLGSYSRSIYCSTRARSLLELCGMSGGQLEQCIMNSLAEVHFVKSEYLEAQSIHRQILGNRSSEQDPSHHVFALLNIAQIGVEISASRHDVQRNVDAAALLLKTPVDRTYSEMLRAALDLRDGNLLQAKTLFQKCIKFAWGADIPTVTYCLERLSNIHQWSATDQTPSTWTVTFLAHSLKYKEKLGIYKAFQFLGDMYLAQGDELSAVSLFSLALEGFTHMDIHRSRAECMIRLGDISQQHGNLPKAVEFWKLARPLFERSSQTKQITYVDEHLACITVDPMEKHLICLKSESQHPA